MLKAFLEFFQNFFSKLFGSGNPGRDTPTPVPEESLPPRDTPTFPPSDNPNPESGENSPPLVEDTVEDASEITDDDIEIIVVDETQVEDSDAIGGNPDIPDISIPDLGSSPHPEPTQHIPRYLWCLDNGHGEQTAGKRSPLLEDGTQILEYQFNRDIVKRIVAQLKVIGVKYYIVVPETDTGNLLEERVKRVNAKSSLLPKLFVSVHSNAAPAPVGKWGNPNVRGIETWYYHTSRRGKKLAAIFQKHLIEKTGFKNRHIKSRPANQFYVLRKTGMTAILTENGFYNNYQEAKLLQTEKVRNQIAAGHVAAILEVEKEGLF